MVIKKNKMIQSDSNQQFRLVIIGVLVVIVALISREILFDETHVVCLHYYLFGFQCPLCGMTRAVHEFTHLQFASAINYNVMVLLFPIYLLMDIATIFFKQNWLARSRKAIVFLIIAGLFLLYVFRIVNHFNWL